MMTRVPAVWTHTVSTLAVVRPRDTSPSAYAARIAVLRRLGSPERVRLAVELSGQFRGQAAAGLRRRHPDWPPERVRPDVLTQLFGAELVDRAWDCQPPDERVPDPRSCDPRTRLGRRGTSTGSGRVAVRAASSRHRTRDAVVYRFVDEQSARTRRALCGPVACR